MSNHWHKKGFYGTNDPSHSEILQIRKHYAGACVGGIQSTCDAIQAKAQFDSPHFLFISAVLGTMRDRTNKGDHMVLSYLDARSNTKVLLLSAACGLLGTFKSQKLNIFITHMYCF